MLPDGKGCPRAIAASPSTTRARRVREDLLAIMREIFGRNAFAERLAYSPEEAAVLDESGYHQYPFLADEP